MIQKRKYIETFFIISFLSLILSVKVSAQSDYNYRMSNRESIEAPTSYEVERTLYAKDIGVDSLSTMTSIFITEDSIYLADIDKIVIMDFDFKVIHILSEYMANGNEEKINGPEGIFVTKEGDIYITEPGNSRIVRFNSNYEFITYYGKPEGMGLDDLIYKPTKIVIDKVGRMYVTAKNVYEGILELNPDGEFSRYFGVNTVTFNAIDLFWRTIATDAQREKMQLWLPTEFTNLAVNNEGFIFTTSKSAEAAKPIKLLNAKGENILTAVKESLYPAGDLDYPMAGSIAGPSNLIAIDCNEYGMYTVLDSKRNRVFTYDENGYLLYIFGGMGDRKGCFLNPVDLKFMGNNIIVVDQLAQSIIIMKPTNYGKLINEAVKFQFDDKMDEASVIWEKVSNMNPNLELAYIGMGNTAFRKGDYEEAARLFKLGYDQINYSKAFDRMRNQYIEDHFNVFAGVFFLLIALILSRKIYKRMKYGKEPERGDDY